MQCMAIERHHPYTNEQLGIRCICTVLLPEETVPNAYRQGSKSEKDMLTLILFLLVISIAAERNTSQEPRSSHPSPGNKSLHDWPIATSPGKRLDVDQAAYIPLQPPEWPGLFRRTGARGPAETHRLLCSKRWRNHRRDGLVRQFSTDARSDVALMLNIP